MSFVPIAIVGSACVLPGALSPAQLWEAVRDGRDLLTQVPAGRWRIPLARALCDPDQPQADRSWSDRGGYVSGFEQIWQPQGFALPAAQLSSLDSLCHWLLHCAREARDQVGSAHGRVGAVFGNLGFPSEAMASYADQVWRGQGTGLDRRNRFMSGGSAKILAQALALEAGSYSLDAACASSLYAIKLACDQLNDGQADLMLAGAVQRADDLFLHIGFSALQALSRSGQSRPFHREADGLVPAEGCAMLALKRLSDARRDGDAIHAVIRGIGLSNDGRGRGLLVPDQNGQARAIRAAYDQSGIDPRKVSLLECHATGTSVGDGAELASSAAVFAGATDLPIGSLKSNLGHLITTAGAAGIIKLCEALKHRQRPPNRPVDAPLAQLAEEPFRLLQQSEQWESDEPRIAAISAFGFGGNNAHLVLSEDDPALPLSSLKHPSVPVAIVGLGSLAGSARNRAELAARLHNGDLRGADGSAPMETLSLDLNGLRFPPSDLRQTLPQQLAVLEAARQALAEVDPLPRERTAVLVGMEPDPEVARYGSRWRAADSEQAWADALIAPLQSAGVIGCMPNIPANRISSQYDLAGPGYTVQAGPDSGLRALQIAVRALRAGELDAALVGAVDLGCEAVNRQANPAHSTDAAVAMVLKPLSIAEAAGDRIYAVIDQADSEPSEPMPEWREALGDAGAADTLLRIAGATLALHQRRGLDGQPWLAAKRRGWALPAPLNGSIIREAEGQRPRSDHARQRLWVYAGANRAAVIAALRANQSGGDGPARLVLVASAIELDGLRHRALAHLQDGAAAGPRIHYRDQPLAGRLAFAFAGAGASYPGMGRDLLIQLPQLQAAVARRSRELACTLDWAIAEAPSPSVAEQLWGASALSQLHSELTLTLLGLRPDGWLGYSSGETNALVAAGVWNDADGLARDMAASGLLSEALGGEFSAVREQWGEPVNWRCWTVAAPLAKVQSALAKHPRAHLAIINSDLDCLIAGDAAACDAVVEEIGASRCLPLEYCLAVHVPEVAQVADAWLQLHQRATDAPLCGQIYSSASGEPYEPNQAACAAAILAQANQTLDMRKVVERAYADGVRIFVEHGPGGGFGRAIRQILSEREALVVSLDRRGKGFEATLGAIAALVAAGLPVDLAGLNQALAEQLPAAQLRPFSLPAHWAPVSPPSTDHREESTINSEPESSPAVQIMQPAPALPPILSADPVVSNARPNARGAAALGQVPDAAEDRERARSYTAVEQSAAAALWMKPGGSELARDRIAAPADAGPLQLWQAQLRLLSERHQAHTQALSQAHEQFLRTRAQAQALLLAQRLPGAAAIPLQAPVAGGVIPRASEPRVTSRPQVSALEPVPKPAPITPKTAVGPAPAATPTAAPKVVTKPTPSADDHPRGPQFDRAQLQVHAEGAISSLFGPAFAAQDGYHHQVRMPQPPLLLADRVLGIDGEPGSMGKGRIWTETDVGSQDWYLHQQRMPAGVMIEAGQADLMLISWLGIDALNRGERVYRLLGCELTYHGDLPRAGDTLDFDILIDGHAAQGDIRLMFFHYDCRTRQADGSLRPQLSVREGQAGFFTAAELADSAGCLWRAEEQKINPDPVLDPPEATPQTSAFERAQLQAFADGLPFQCFGSGYEFARTHTRSPGIHGGRMLLLDRITELAPGGGPWQRGYLRAELDIHPEQWFFDGHFKNDPCMPGTLMFEACLQAMAIYLAGCGYTLRRDGWRFQPIPEQPYQLQCRGQVTPRSRRLVTEVFVEERCAGPVPYIYADLLCTVDGLKAFHARRVGLQLVPDWPLEERRAQGEELRAQGSGLRAQEKQQIAEVDGFRFDQDALLACALGKPSKAFGPMYQRFDGPIRVARLPSPPYHFISRIAEVQGPIGKLKAGARVVAEYDLPDQVWYLTENGCPKMPFAVLLEAALQPCGWLSSYVGSTLTVDEELGFRNLDGDGEVLVELSGGDGTLRTEVELVDVSASAGMIIEKFAVSCWLGERQVYRLNTVFGFFPPAALAAQAGLPVNDGHRELLQREGSEVIDLDAHPEDYFASERPRLAGDMLRMIDRIEGVWPTGGAAGLGQLRAVKDVDSDEWFFKAHFFQDPVQPGSLGLEAMLQTLQFYLLHQHKDAGIARPRFQTIALEKAHRWRYRGQVLPHHRQVHTTLEVTAEGQDEHGYYAVADASLWVDGQRIYEASGLAVRIVSDSD